MQLYFSSPCLIFSLKNYFSFYVTYVTFDVQTVNYNIICWTERGTCYTYDLGKFLSLSIALIGKMRIIIVHIPHKFVVRIPLLNIYKDFEHRLAHSKCNKVLVYLLNKQIILPCPLLSWSISWLCLLLSRLFYLEFDSYSYQQNFLKITII